MRRLFDCNCNWQRTPFGIPFLHSQVQRQALSVKSIQLPQSIGPQPAELSGNPRWREIDRPEWRKAIRCLSNESERLSELSSGRDSENQESPFVVTVEPFSDIRFRLR
jgi:hypothetical protein